jgi:hypothetical protein
VRAALAARERTVSLVRARTNFSRTAGVVSASSVVSHTEPVHTPLAPRTMAAAIWRPLAMPPRRGPAGRYDWPKR